VNFHASLIITYKSESQILTVEKNPLNILNRVYIKYRQRFTVESTTHTVTNATRPTQIITAETGRRGLVVPEYKTTRGGLGIVEETLKDSTEYSDAINGLLIIELFEKRTPNNQYPKRVI